jgi:phosphinothricin acetyltransferase
MMLVRLARRDDVPAILGISNWAALNTHANFAVELETLESWTDSFDRTHERFPWLVAEDDAMRVIGFAKASPHRSRCAYAWTAEVSVYVHPDHHGQGIGTALYGRLIPLLKAQGFVTLIAGIAGPNPASERLHESFGFQRVGVFERVGWKFDRWHDVGYWEAFLKEGDEPPAPLRTVREIASERAEQLVKVNPPENVAPVPRA